MRRNPKSCLLGHNLYLKGTFKVKEEEPYTIESYFLADFIAVFVTLAAALTFASAQEATCLLALVMLSKAAVAAFTVDLNAAIATSLPAGADLTALSNAAVTFLLISAI